MNKCAATDSGLIVSPFFREERVKSDRVYPKTYVKKPNCEQLLKFAAHFPKLDAEDALRQYKTLPPLIQGAEHMFLIPRPEKVAKTHNDRVELALDLLGKTRTFKNWLAGQLSEKYLRQSERTAEYWDLLQKQQKGDYLLVQAQAGLLWAGASVRHVRQNYAKNEAGADSYLGAMILLSHPERLVGEANELYMDFPGDEYATGTDGRFAGAPCFCWSDGRPRFFARWVGLARASCGSASGFLPQ